MHNTKKKTAATIAAIVTSTVDGAASAVAPAPAPHAADVEPPLNLKSPHVGHIFFFIDGIALAPIMLPPSKQVAGKQCELMGAVTSIAVCPGNKGFFVGTSLANRCTPHRGICTRGSGAAVLSPPCLVEVAVGKGGVVLCFINRGMEQQTTAL